MKSYYALILALSMGLQPMLSGQQAWAADLPEDPEPRVSLKDPPVASPFLWTGLYFGGHLGGGWGNAAVNDTFIYVGDPTFNGSLGNASFIGGAQAGYNMQRGKFVFGLEADIGYLGLSASKSANFQQSSCSATYTTPPYAVSYPAQMCAVDGKYSISSDLYADITGRLGYSLGRTLLYVKGGVAFLNADFSANYFGQNCKTLGTCGTGGPSTFNFGRDGTLAGWTAGLGAELALNSSWSLKAEFQHFDFGSTSYSYSGTYFIPGYSHDGGHYTSVITGRTSVSLTADVAKIGLNYHLKSDIGLD